LETKENLKVSMSKGIMVGYISLLKKIKMSTRHKGRSLKHFGHKHGKMDNLCSLSSTMTSS
jgi:hypothetical protein